MFKESKQHCDYLIIALQDDPTIERSTKCKPAHTLEERREILESIRYIDKIVTYNIESDLYELLKNTEYSLRILGVEYKEKNYTGKDLSKEVLWLERSHNYSTTNLKEKIYKERQEFKQKL